jgi:hypothetical protein
MEIIVSVVDDITAYAEECLPSRRLETGCIIPLLYRSSVRIT